MLDTALRRVVGPPLAVAGARLAKAGVNATALTAAGWVIGVGACVAAGFGQWITALVLWLVNRTVDGLDGPTARACEPSDTGGFLDIVADFTVYAGFVLGVAVARPEARLACVALLVAYYASATAFLALSSLLEKRRQRFGDARSLRFVGGLAEGAETIVVYVLFCVLPTHARVIAWAFAAVVAATAVQRVWWAVRLLRVEPMTPHET